MSDTAFMVAAFRATETERPDALFRDPLASKLAGRHGRTIVLTEGVVPYLRTDEGALLADELRAHRAVRFSPATRRFRMPMRLRMIMQNAPFRFDPDDYFAFFRRHGWAPREVRYPSDEAKKRGRPLEAPLTFRLSLRLMQLSMSKASRNALGKSAAYVLFEPADPTGP